MNICFLEGLSKRFCSEKLVQVVVIINLNAPPPYTKVTKIIPNDNGFFDGKYGVKTDVCSNNRANHPKQHSRTFFRFRWRRVPRKSVTKKVGGSYRIHILVFLTPLLIFVTSLEILFFINHYFLVYIFKYHTSLWVNSGLEI